MTPVFEIRDACDVAGSRYREIQAYLAGSRANWLALDDDASLFPDGCTELVLCDDGFRDAEERALRNLLLPKPDESTFVEPGGLEGGPKATSWRVVDVQATSELSLQVRFADGVQGTVRFEPAHLTGVFEVLKDPRFFNQVRVEFGAVTWPGELDLAPDAMYDEIKAHGEWVLR